jgi:integration host factor subunit beta
MGHTQKTIADIISKELGLPQRTGRKFLQRVIDIIADDIVFTGRSEIRGLGTFNITEKPPVQTTHPETGNPVTISQKKILHFRTSSQIRRRLNPSKPGTRKTAKNKKTSA